MSASKAGMPAPALRNMRRSEAIQAVYEALQPEKFRETTPVKSCSSECETIVPVQTTGGVSVRRYFHL